MDRLFSYPPEPDDTLCVTQNRYRQRVTGGLPKRVYDGAVAHVFQMMAGTTRSSPISFKGLQSARRPDSVFDLQIERNAFDSVEVFETIDATGRMCTCPVCRS